MITALARQAFRKNCKLVGTAFFNETVGPTLLYNHINEVAQEMGKEYGVDWVNLGYRLNAEGMHEGNGRRCVGRRRRC